MIRGKNTMNYKVKVGDPMPKFVARDQDGHSIDSSHLLGNPVVIYFYPKDDTPGCTKEACSFRDNMTNLNKMGISVIGVSPDNAESHQAFIKKHHLNFSLLADESKDICNKFGVMHEKNIDGTKTTILERSTFFIDSKGIIQWIERPVNVEGHTERVIIAINTKKIK
jgi:thioredoxin-dependent peroxiredoxin